MFRESILQLVFIYLLSSCVYYAPANGQGNRGVVMNNQKIDASASENVTSNLTTTLISTTPALTTKTTAKPQVIILQLNDIKEFGRNFYYLQSFIMF